MKKISISTLKGGVGKSICAFSIAGFLAKKKKKVLLVDADPQANTTANCGFDQELQDYENLADIFDKGTSPTFVVIERPIEGIPNIDLIPSHINLTTVDMRIINRGGREKILKKYFDEHEDYFKKYDYIIFDLAPNINIVNQNCLFMSDSILLVSDVGMNSFNGAKLLLDAWDELSDMLDIENNIKGLIINRYDKRVKLSKEFIEYIKESDKLNELAFDTLIPENIKLKESEVQGVPISHYDTKCSSYKAFQKLMKELSERGII